MIIATGGIEQTWKIIRSTIFKHIICNTLPKEVMTALKLSYYDLMVKPAVKTVEKLWEMNKNIEMFNFYKKKFDNNF